MILAIESCVFCPPWYLLAGALLSRFVRCVGLRVSITDQVRHSAVKAGKSSRHEGLKPISKLDRVSIRRSGDLPCDMSRSVPPFGGCKRFHSRFANPVLRHRRLTSDQ